MQFGSNIDLQNNRITNLANGVNPTDAINLSQLQTATSGGGLLLGYFQVAVTEGYGIISIPTTFQSKTNYICFSESLLIPPQYVTKSTTNLYFSTSNFFIMTGTITVFVFS